MTDLVEFDVVVFVPTLVSRLRRFHQWGEIQPAIGHVAGLYVTSGELHEELANCPHWPVDAYIATKRVDMGVEWPDGETRVDGHRKEVCHGVKLSFVLVAAGPPPLKAWPHRWAVKSITPVPGPQAA